MLRVHRSSARLRCTPRQHVQMLRVEVVRVEAVVHVEVLRVEAVRVEVVVHVEVVHVRGRVESTGGSTTQTAKA